MGLRAAALTALAAAFLAPAAVAAEPARPPLAVVGGPLAGEGRPASVLRPSTLHAEFRVPPTDDTALFIAAPWYVRDMTITLDGPAGRRRTIVATAELPGHTLGLRLPADASAAERVELTATTVSTAAPPYLLPTEALAAIGWRTWWYAAFFGSFAALAALAGVVAGALRSRVMLWYGVTNAAQAALLVPWLGIVRPPPEVSQPLHAALQTLVYAGLAALVLTYLRDAGVPRVRASVVWALVLLNTFAVTGGDVLQDLWPFPDALTQLLVLALYGACAVLGVVAARQGFAGAWNLAAASALVGAGGLAAMLSPVLPLAGTAVAALLLPLAVFARLRQVERERARPALLAHLDGLTGIANRDALDDALARASDRASRARSPLAAILIDLDHFRGYNDTYGHAAGDDALRRIAAVFAQRVARSGDIAGRFAGDKFVVLLPDTDLSGAQLIAGRLRDGIAALEIAHGGAPSRRLSVSIGVASLVPQPNAGGGELMRRASNALFLAKSMGRNRVVADEPLGGVAWVPATA